MDIDFDKNGVPSKMVPPPKESDAEIEKRDKARSDKRADEIKKGAAEYAENPKRANEAAKKLQELVRRGGGGGGGGGLNFSPRPGVSPSADKMLNMAKGGKVSSASTRADGIAQRGKTRGRMR